MLVAHTKVKFIQVQRNGLGGVRPYQIFPRLRMIHHPFCELCDAPMWLTSIEPDKPGHEVRVVNYRDQKEVGA
jgi:hypothetical protein